MYDTRDWISDERAARGAGMLMSEETASRISWILTGVVILFSSPLIALYILMLQEGGI